MMKILLTILFFSPTVFAGRAHIGLALVRSVDCVVLESMPLQYTGTAELTLKKNNQRVTMKFVPGEDVDIYEICTQLQDSEGQTVKAIYNLDKMPSDAPVPPAIYFIKGFQHQGHAHIVDGSSFEDSE